MAEPDHTTRRKPRRAMSEPRAATRGTARAGSEPKLRSKGQGRRRRSTLHCRYRALRTGLVRRAEIQATRQCRPAHGQDCSALHSTPPRWRHKHPGGRVFEWPKPTPHPLQPTRVDPAHFSCLTCGLSPLHRLLIPLLVSESSRSSHRCCNKRGPGATMLAGAGPTTARRRMRLVRSRLNSATIRFDLRRIPNLHPDVSRQSCWSAMNLLSARWHSRAYDR